MTTINDGGLAYPFPGGDADRYDSEHGMSLRDYFAGKAMQAFIASKVILTVNGGKAVSPNDPRYGQALSEASYTCADNMIAEREKTT